MTNSVLRLLPVEHTPEQQTVQGDTVFFFFFLYQQFITRGAMAGRGNYLVATIH